MNSTCKRESQVQINTWFDYATHCYAVFANFLACDLFSCCPMSQKQITFPITQLLCPDKDSSCLDCVHRRHSLSQWSTKFFLMSHLWLASSIKGTPSFFYMLTTVFVSGFQSLCSFVLNQTCPAFLHLIML